MWIYDITYRRVNIYSLYFYVWDTHLYVKLFHLRWYLQMDEECCIFTFLIWFLLRTLIFLFLYSSWLRSSPYLYLYLLLFDPQLSCYLVAAPLHRTFFCNMRRDYSEEPSFLCLGFKPPSLTNFVTAPQSGAWGNLILRTSLPPAWLEGITGPELHYFINLTMEQREFFGHPINRLLRNRAHIPAASIIRWNGTCPCSW